MARRPRARARRRRNPAWYQRLRWWHYALGAVAIAGGGYVAYRKHKKLPLLPWHASGPGAQDALPDVGGTDATTDAPAEVAQGPSEVGGALQTVANDYGLVGNASRAHAEFVRVHPDAVTTSGFRTPADDARAMAGHVVKNRQFIRDTYIHKKNAAGGFALDAQGHKILLMPAHQALQDWVNANPQATTQDDLAAGLLGVMNAMPPEELATVSFHLEGEAWDTKPDGDKGKTTDLQSLVNQHTANGGKARLLTNEAGAVVWHAQFDDSVVTQFALPGVNA